MKAANPIDILFTDVVMPGGMSGIELANQAVAVSPALKVLITTGYPGHAELLRNEFAVLPKPFTRLDLELLIRSLIKSPDHGAGADPAARRARRRAALTDIGPPASRTRPKRRARRTILRLASRAGL